MRNFYLFIAMLLIIGSAYADSFNANPDPDGEPWWVGGVTPPSMEELNAVPEFQLPFSAPMLKALPSSVDNSELKYFRPVFRQRNGSCAQASGIGYAYTYEISVLRDLDATLTENQYPSHFTYNFLNRGSGSNGSWHTSGWNIAIENGIPNVDTYGGMAALSDTGWMSGYEKYQDSMSNRIMNHSYINVSTVAGLDTFKEWMVDHGNGSANGGVAVFAVDFSATYKTVPAGTHQGGSSIVTAWNDCSSCGHAMTFVGYDDEVRYDFNGDGRYTNDEDINGDGVVNLKDWEIGAVIIVNSHGTSWRDQGKSYMMYRVLAESQADGGIWYNRVYILNAQDEYTPELTIKATLTHSVRHRIRMTAGISQDINATQPDFTKDFNIFRYQGGRNETSTRTRIERPIRGAGNNDPIEIGLDISDLLENIDGSLPYKVFYNIVENDSADRGQGQINSVSIIDYSQGEEEYISTSSNVAIENDTTTTLSVVNTKEISSPDIDVNSYVYITSVRVNSSTMSIMRIKNTGTAELTGTITDPSSSAFAIDKNSFSIAAGESEEFILTFRPTDETSYSGSFTINSNDPDESTLNVNFSASGTAVPNKNFDQVHIRGTFNSWNTEKMTLVENNSWVIPVKVGSATDERFKFDINGDWSYQFGDDNSDFYADQNGADIPITSSGFKKISFNDNTKHYYVTSASSHDLTATAAEDAITLRWDGISGPRGVYNYLYRKDSATGDFKEVFRYNSYRDSFEWTDTNVEAGKTYYYYLNIYTGGYQGMGSQDYYSDVVEAKIAGSWERTIVMIYGETKTGEDMFIRGGLDHDYANNNLGRNCTTDNFECAMPIRHLNMRNSTTAPWKSGDSYLDWYGIEASQGSGADGTPLDWTIDNWPSEWGTTPYYNIDGYGETPLNTYGAHYWLLEVEMDCSATDQGWFELKSYIKNGSGWEGDIYQSGTPYNTKNHFAQCGKMSVFRRNQNNPVEIKDIP